MTERTRPSHTQRSDWRNALRDELWAGRLLRGPIGKAFLFSVAVAGCVLGMVGRAWDPVLWILSVCATTAAIVAVRWPDRWALRWWVLAAWIGRDQRRAQTAALGLERPAVITLEWLDTRPTGSVPDGVRAGVLLRSGRILEAREVAAATASSLSHSEARLELFNRIADRAEGSRPDFSRAHAMVASITGPDGVRLRAHVSWEDFLAAVSANEQLRWLPAPETRDLNIPLKTRLRIWRWFISPTDWFLALAIGTYLALSMLSALVPSP